MGTQGLEDIKVGPKEGDKLRLTIGTEVMVGREEKEEKSGD